MVNLSDVIYLAAKLIYLATAMKPFVIVVSILLSLNACKSGEPETDSTLDLNPGTDSIYHYSAVLSESSMMNEKKFINTISMDYSLHCIESKDSLRTFELVFEKLAEERKTQGDTSTAPAPPPQKGVIRVDFSDTSNPIIKQYYSRRDSVFNKVVNQSLVITCRDNGKVISVKGFDEIGNRIASQDTTYRTAVVMLRDKIGPEIMTDILHQSFFYIRKQPIDSGASWVNNILLIAKAPVKYSNMVTVNRIIGDSVYLDVKSMMSAKTGEEGSVYNQGEQTGTVLVSLSTGMPIQMHLSETSVYKADAYDVEKGKTFSLRIIRK